MNIAQQPKFFQPVTTELIKEKHDWLFTTAELKERRSLLRQFKRNFPSLHLTLDFLFPSMFIKNIKQDAGNLAVVIWLSLADELNLNDPGADFTRQATAGISALLDPLKENPEALTEIIESYAEPHLMRYVYDAVEKKFPDDDDAFLIKWPVLAGLCTVAEVILESRKRYFYRNRPYPFPEQPLQELHDPQTVCRLECILALLDEQTYPSLADIVQKEKQLYGDDNSAFSEKTVENDITTLRRYFKLPIRKDRTKKGYAYTRQILPVTVEDLANFEIEKFEKMSEMMSKCSFPNIKLPEN